MLCVAHRCPDEALPGGQLCREHQRRLDRGGGLPGFGEPVKGDPSGHGRYGLADSNDLGVLCHECGDRFASVGLHVSRAHHISSAEYETLHGVKPGKAPKRADGKVRRRAHPCGRCKTPVTTHGKLCEPCKAEWLREEAERRARPKPEPRPRWRDLTDDERRELADAGRDELGDLITRLQLDRVGINRIAAALGVNTKQLRAKYPAPARYDS